MNIPERVEEIQKKFNRFIEKWCGVNFPHLIDSDENDGEEFREELRTALTETDQQAREEVAERIAWLDRIAEAYLHVEATGTPNDSMKGQIHGFKQAYNIIKTGLIDSPLSLSNPPSQV